MKAAIVLFVKNEVTDISDWISWHLSIGFDKIFIYDDHSDDGTFEICSILSDFYNIELKKTNIESETNFFIRQKLSYFDACKNSSNKYDWICFLDSDEYLYLDEDDSIKSFLSSYEDCNAIALNWCIYGSSNKTIKDHIPIYKSFVFHSSRELNDNRLVKSIIRPCFYTFNYTDPHRFYLENEEYRDSLGEKFEWDGSTKNIEWKRARINHYICRSMEHYINRIKRRIGSDLVNSNVYWNHFDRNDIEFHIDERKIHKANEILEKIKNILVDNFIFNKKLLNMKYKNNFSIEGSTSKQYVIKTKNNTYLKLDGPDGFVSQTLDISSENNPIYGIIYENDDEYIYIYSANDIGISNIKFHIRDINNHKYCYKLKLEYLDDNSICIINPKTNKYLCAVPQELDGSVSCNRDSHSVWEEFFLIETSSQIKTECLPSNIFDFYSFINEIVNKNFNYNDFMILSQNIENSEKEKLIKDSNNTLSCIL
ncbi:glycosyltransferase family 2 protein [Acetobacter thailandicus]|uniref:glycosyltransferase family 2 protein n=1 Tax=Acetobacter thailandicus TaxID=1502842 RepID=UPI001BAB674F|nr:glycosyltransferase family 2 protein [Acetobacter thailandicus]MBS0980968.1 glycosyltransferase family 2 protein [Acetobacter thailandicus]